LSRSLKITRKEGGRTKTNKQNATRQHIRNEMTEVRESYVSPSRVYGGRSGATPQQLRDWVSTFAKTCFSCTICKEILQEPVMILPKKVFACALCAKDRINADNIDEAPQAVVSAAYNLRLFDDYLKEEDVHQAAAIASSGKKIRAIRRSVPAEPLGSPEAKANVYHVGSAATEAASSTPAAVPHDPGQPNNTPSNTFTGRNPNLDVLNRQKTHQSTPNAPIPPPNITTDHQPHAEHNSLDMDDIAEQTNEPALGVFRSDDRSAQREVLHMRVGLIVDEELEARQRVEMEWQLERTELQKKKSSETRSIQGKRKSSSKQLKIEADTKYESAQYNEAIDLYSRAIEAQKTDGLARPGTLHGNRSAAYYMAGKFQESIDDCELVVQLEPENVKMFTRAAKAAVAMGDLELAARYYQRIPPHLATESTSSERDKLVSGAELLRRAEQQFGTPEGDELYQMIMIQFSDTTSFRLRLAESLAAQKQFAKACDVVSIVSPSMRTPRIAYFLARNMYMTGFEKFEQARAVLEPFRSDEACAALLKQINAVDDGKQRGNALFSQKDFAAAAEVYSHAISAAQGNGQILRILYCNRAAANKEIGKYREGIEDCTKAIQIDTLFPKAYARRARCHLQLKDFISAIRDFQIAIQYDPSDHDLVRELKNAQIMQQKEADNEKDFYYVLGVHRTSTASEIKAKFKELSLKWHPDKCVTMDAEQRAEAERKFKVIMEAHATLKDPDRRREYDLKQSDRAFTRPTSGFTSYGFPGSGASAGGFPRPSGFGMPAYQSATSHYPGSGRYPSNW
jgi:tetratricopeptide (TPR) repeat protein